MRTTAVPLDCAFTGTEWLTFYLDSSGTLLLERSLTPGAGERLVPVLALEDCQSERRARQVARALLDRQLAAGAEDRRTRAPMDEMALSDTGAWNMQTAGRCLEGPVAPVRARAALTRALLPFAA